jgi:DNA polymerase
MNKEWEELYETCKSCTKCPLCETRTNVVFGTGNREARIMFVGEAPGEKEDASGIPFVGAAGRLLDRFLFAVDINRQDIYIANILKCRPPKNRDPLPAEEDACLDYLREQTRLISPEIIVCLGRIAAKRLIRPDYKITEEHGQFVKRGKYLITAVYHPAALLRDPRKNEDMLRDFKALKEQLAVRSGE